MSEVPETLAQQALENLVNQFARPLDFLRELVQNSIDAGSPRVEVWLRYQPSEQVLEIHVDDFGEGMDEHVIDNHLTRLFASTKEDDLTKIGKFGIGFTSIFAIQPDAVLLRTGRHGESWELLFHADRSFDKVRLDVPVDGTRITLYRRMRPDAVDGFVRDCRWILGWWCEHSDTPVTFWDRTDERAATSAAAPSDDPFGAWTVTPDTESAPEAVNRPLALDDTLLDHTQTTDTVHVVVGYGETHRYAFYNGGLTLLNSLNPQVLGDFAPRLQHLCFKLKSNKLEHTLTRDNVIQDAHWRAAMGDLVTAADRLRTDLVDQTERAAADPSVDLGPWHRRLAQECATPDFPRLWGIRWRHRAVFRDTLGRPRTLSQVEAQEHAQGAVLFQTANDRLAAALEAEGVFLLQDQPHTRAMLTRGWRPPVLAFWDRGRVLRRADEIYVLPDPVSWGLLSDRERLLVEHSSALIQRACRGRVRVVVGAFGGQTRALDAPLALEGPEDGRVFQRPEASWLRIPAFLVHRSVLLNRWHPTFQLLATAAAEDLDVASYGLAQLLLNEEAREGDRAYTRLLHAALQAAG